MKSYLRLLLIICFVPLSFCASAQNGPSDLCLNTVVIDPGHGGKDPGTVSPDKKTYEKTLTLAISKILAEKIRGEYPSMNVIMTRDRDVYVPLDERARKASDNNANLFISIHINAVKKNTPYSHGFSAYILGQSKDKSKDTYAFNMEVVARENSVVYLEDDYGTKYQDDDSPEAQILMKFMYNAFREQSLLFAEQVNDEMKQGPFRKCGGVYQANLFVLRLASMPAVLLELGYMTNAEDLVTLRSDKAVSMMADNVFKAFCKFKTEYDRSVTSEEIALSKESAAVETAAKPAEPAAAAFPAAEEVSGSTTFYGIQVLVSSRKMASSDKFFKGYESTSIQCGDMFKYIIMPSDSADQVKRAFQSVKKVFPDSFVVKIEGGKISALR